MHHPADSALVKGLIAARKAANMHQSVLAGLLGRPQSFVSKFEKGERRLDVIEFLCVCRALAVDPENILATVASTLAAEPLSL